MNTNNGKKLKKYLFLISILFFSVTFSHLFYSYIYNDSQLVPIKGGSMYEGLIGNFPTLNPLKKSGANNDYIVSLLYRSLVKYDPEQGKILGDIAACDISNISKVECYINDNAKWSDGTQISSDDIIATYKVIQNTDVNISLKKTLENTKITQNQNAIVFENETKDVNFINALFQPIVSQKIIDELTQVELNGDFSTTNQLYSGLFILSGIKSDRTKGYTDIILDKNLYSQDSENVIDKLTLKIFPNTNSFLKNKESIHIFNDKDNLLGDSVPRFNNYDYTLPQFVGIFLNNQNINDDNLRAIILNTIKRENLLKIIGEKSFLPVYNPYLGDKKIISQSQNKNFVEIMKKLGYTKKSQILEEFLPKKKTISGEVIITKKPEDFREELKDTPVDIKTLQSDSKTIYAPEFVDVYNFITKPNLLLTGRAPIGVEAVYVNDYKLQSYTKGSKDFYYRLSTLNKNLTLGENSYKIYFQTNGKKKLQEEIHFLYYPNKADLTKNTQPYLEKIFLEKRAKQEELVQKNTQVKKADIEINKSELEEITTLDEKWYYNEKKEPFTLKLTYISTQQHFEQTAAYTKKVLEELGIQIELHPVSILELAKLREQKDQYDIFLGGINMGYFSNNIFPYFHSSQAALGNNFSNVKKTSLDILLEDLKSKVQSDDDSKALANKVLDILEKQQVIKTLYTPRLHLLVDKNIKTNFEADMLPQMKHRSYLFTHSYTKEKKLVNMENKGVIGFFGYLLNTIYE